MPRISAIVPAAGRGSRLLPFPCPKELFPIGYQDYRLEHGVEKRPKVVSQYLLENLISAGADKVFMVLGQGKWDIMRYYGDGGRFGANIAYLFQDRLTGMPGAIDLARPWVGEDTILFGMPDTIIEPADCFAQLIADHHDNGADVTLALFATDNPTKFGMVDIDHNGFVRRTIDKPTRTNLHLMWGAACWSARFTRLIGTYLKGRPFTGKEIVLGDLINNAIDTGLVVRGITFEDGVYMDIGTTRELQSALKQFHL